MVNGGESHSLESLRSGDIAEAVLDEAASRVRDLAIAEASKLRDDQLPRIPVGRLGGHADAIHTIAEIRGLLVRPFLARADGNLIEAPLIFTRRGLFLCGMTGVRVGSGKALRWYPFWGGDEAGREIPASYWLRYGTQIIRRLEGLSESSTNREDAGSTVEVSWYEREAEPACD